LVMHEILHHLYAKSNLSSEIPDSHMLIFPLIANLSKVYDASLMQQKLYNSNKELYNISPEELEASQVLQRALAKVVNSVLEIKYQKPENFVRHKITSFVYPLGGGVIDVQINKDTDYNPNDAISSGDKKSYISMGSAVTNGLIARHDTCYIRHDVPYYCRPKLIEILDKTIFDYAGIINLTAINSYIELNGKAKAEVYHNEGKEHLKRSYFHSRHRSPSLLYNTKVVNSEIVLDEMTNDVLYDVLLVSSNIVDSSITNKFKYPTDRGHSPAYEADIEIKHSNINSSTIKKSSLNGWNIYKSKVTDSRLTGNNSSATATTLTGYNVHATHSEFTRLNTSKNFKDRSLAPKIWGDFLKITDTSLERVNLTGNNNEIKGSFLKHVKLRGLDSSRIKNSNISNDWLRYDGDDCYSHESGCDKFLLPKISIMPEVEISNFNLKFLAGTYHSHDNAFMFKKSLRFDPFKKYVATNMTTPGWLSALKVYTPDLSSIESFEHGFFSFDNRVENYDAK